MSILDQTDRWASIDPQSMRLLLESFPEQVRAAWKAAQTISFAVTHKPRNIVVTGLGGSAIGGDIVRLVIGRELRVPLIVNRDYTLPGFIDSSSLVIACSYSGNTEETISTYQEAGQAKASTVCITSGGRLEAMARSDGCPVVSLPVGLPPRAALGHSLVLLLGTLQALHLIPDMTASLEETNELLSSLLGQYGSAIPEARNLAKRVARSLHGKIIAIYGSNAILDAAAYRWRTQIEENSKNLAFHHVLPEMNHNELVGWRFPEGIMRFIGVVLLRDKGDHPQVQRRFDLTQEIIRERAGALHEVWSEGESLLARILCTIYLGDFVSLYLAYLNDTDPTPVEVIEYLKRSLSATTDG